MFSFLRKLTTQFTQVLNDVVFEVFFKIFGFLIARNAASAAIITEVDNGGLSLFGISDRGPINHFEGTLAEGC
jgi:hypothetical protein